MEISRDIDAPVAALLSQDERVRDVAADELGDIIEHHRGRTSLQLQSVIDALGAALEIESSQLVVESMLNAISKAKYHGLPLQLPLAIVRRKLRSCEGTAIEHAKYILEGA